MKGYRSVRQFLHIWRKYGFYQSISIHKQARSKKNYLEFKYNTEKLRIKNETSVFFVLLHSIDTMKKLAESMSEVETMFDIGANCGLFSYFVKKMYPEIKIYVFEPNEDLFDIINFNLRNYRNWNLEKYIVSDQSEESKFYINLDSNQSSTMVSSEVATMYSAGRVEERLYESISLDDFCFMKNIDSNISLKIDVQGAESKVLRGSKKIFPKIKDILLEFWLETDFYELMNLIPSNYRENKKCVHDGKFYADILFRNKKIQK